MVPRYLFQVCREEGGGFTSNPYGAEASDGLDISVSQPDAYLEIV